MIGAATLGPANANGAGEAGAARISAIIVTHDSVAEVERSLPPLLAELRHDDELIVVDNRSTDGTAARVRELAPSARVVEQAENLGYGGGCNAGAAVATGELLLLLNPDAAVQPGFRDAIEQPLVESRGWAAWQALVTSGEGTLVNSTGGVVHFTGIAWAGGDGLPMEAGAGGDEPLEVRAAGRASRSDRPAGAGDAAAPPFEPHAIAFASGTCLAIPRARWDELGGFPAGFFLYHEDVDLSLRLRLAGHPVGIEPRAVVDHVYEFDKGPAKWRYLERNRWATLIRTYPAGLLLVLLPALVATELALLGVALAGGWLAQKLRAWIDLARAGPGLLRSRCEIQASRRASAAEFAGSLSAELGSRHLGALGRSPLIGWLLRVYWRFARLLLGGSRGSS